jgi:hypothetical protein
VVVNSLSVTHRYVVLFTNRSGEPHAINTQPIQITQCRFGDWLAPVVAKPFPNSGQSLPLSRHFKKARPTLCVVHPSVKAVLCEQFVVRTHFGDPTPMHNK